MVDSEGTSQQLDVITPCVSSSSSQSGTADPSSNCSAASHGWAAAGLGQTAQTPA